MGETMTDAEYSIERLTAWIRDYGHEKQAAFIRDLVTVLSLANDAVRDGDNCRTKFEDLIDWLESEEDSCHAALEECVNKGYKDLECAHLKGSDVARATIEWIQKNVLEATGEQEP